MAADEEYSLRRERATIIYRDGSGRRVFIMMIAGVDHLLRRQRASATEFSVDRSSALIRESR